MRPRPHSFQRRMRRWPCRAPPSEVRDEASSSMSATGTIDITPTTEAAPATETTTPPAAKQPAPARQARRWPWIVSPVDVAAAAAARTGLAVASANEAQAELVALQEQYGDLETRATTAQSSLDMMRESRDRLELQLEELQAAE